jgi:hypothetical protein
MAAGGGGSAVPSAGTESADDKAVERFKLKKMIASLDKARGYVKSLDPSRSPASVVVRGCYHPPMCEWAYVVG